MEPIYTRKQLNWLMDEFISSFVYAMPNGKQKTIHTQKRDGCVMCVMEVTVDEIKEVIAKKS
jgi:hypothetical protein